MQSDCPHRERFGYGGDPLGCGEAGLSIYDWSTFYPKRVQDFNDAQTVDPSTGKPAAFPETSPFVGIRCGGCGADGACFFPDTRTRNMMNSMDSSSDSRPSCQLVGSIPDICLG